MSEPKAIGHGTGSYAASRIGVPAYALAAYRGAPRDIVLAFKERGRRDLAPALGGLLARACLEPPVAACTHQRCLCLVPVPSRASAARTRGGDHMLRIARRAAWSLHQHGVASTVAPALRLRSGARDAVGLDRAGRTANVADNLQLATDRMPPEGVPVVLVDDVVTSGATARACVRALHNAGASVTAVVAMTSAQR